MTQYMLRCKEIIAFTLYRQHFVVLRFHKMLPLQVSQNFTTMDYVLKNLALALQIRSPPFSCYQFYKIKNRVWDVL